jgi:pimeloyl-ACP methyl ester carboxylesterase
MEVAKGMVFRRDGTALRYHLHGKGKPTVLLNGMVCSVHYWPYFLEHFAPSRRMLVWDYTGHGNSSDPLDPKDVSIETFADDCALVMEGAGLEQAVIVGHSMGVQVMMEFYRRYPERVKAMIALCGIYGHPLRSWIKLDMMEKLIADLIRGFVPFSRPFWWSLGPLLKTSLPIWVAYQVGANPEICPRGPLEELFANVRRMDPRVALRIMASMCTYSAESVLPSIRVPTLAIGGEIDRMTPPKRTREMAAMIPRARYAVLERCSHLAQIEDPQRVHALVEQFLKKHGC